MKTQFWKLCSSGKSELLADVGESESDILTDIVRTAVADLPGSGRAKAVVIDSVDVGGCVKNAWSLSLELPKGLRFGSALLASRRIGLTSNLVAIELNKARKSPRPPNWDGPWPAATVRGVTFQYAEDVKGID